MRKRFELQMSIGQTLISEIYINAPSKSFFYFVCYFSIIFAAKLSISFLCVSFCINSCYSIIYMYNE